MADKHTITGISVLTIMFPRSNPTLLACGLIEASYPIFSGSLIFNGMNWIGSDGQQDLGPRATARRSICGELTLQPKLVQSPPAVVPTSAERDEFYWLAMGIAASVRPWMDFWQLISAERFSQLANRPREGVCAICSVHVAALPDELWQLLVSYWHKFGNISLNRLFVVTSVAEILAKRTGFGFGDDQIYQHFLLSHGCPEARQIPVVEEITIGIAGEPFWSYQEYLNEYDIERKPFTAPRTR